MSKYTGPALSARFVNVSPIYDLGLTDSGNYAQMLVALFSGVSGCRGTRCRPAISGFF